ncbi:MAG: hypothetical protein IT348_17740 [Candidatus Eisenbacteria bacterium]|nr:hypothetical protein [Candidatus Eisenbacteria bacterium]
MLNAVEDCVEGLPIAIRVASEDGQECEFESLTARPLGLDQLANAGPERSNTFDVDLLAESGLVNGARVRGCSLRMRPFVSAEPVTVFGLVAGGWLPISLAAPPRYLIDRSMVGMFRRLAAGTGRRDAPANQWWLGRFPVPDPWINALPCALEGDQRTTPSFDAFVRSLRAAELDVRRVLPAARQPMFGPDTLPELYRVIAELSHRIPAETNFLLQAEPLIREPRGTRERPQVQRQILTLAAQCNLRHGSLALAAVISSLYDTGAPASGRGIIKPRAGYDSGDAYNALSDLRMLELAAVAGIWGTSSKQLIDPHILLTRDRAVAEMWCTLRPRCVRCDESGAQITCDLDPRGFPNYPENELEELRVALESF